MGEIQESHPHALLIAYIDDVLLVTPPELAPALWRDWALALEERGMSLNQSKREAWIPLATTPHPLLESVVRQSFQGLKLMGNAIEEQLFHIMRT